MLAHGAFCRSAYGRFLPLFARTEGWSGKAAKGRFDAFAKPSRNARFLRAADGRSST